MLARMDLGRVGAAWKIAIVLVILLATAGCHPVREKRQVRAEGVQTGHPNVIVFYAYSTISPQPAVSQASIDNIEDALTEESFEEVSEEKGEEEVKVIHVVSSDLENLPQNAKDKAQNFEGENLEKSFDQTPEEVETVSDRLIPSNREGGHQGFDSQNEQNSQDTLPFDLTQASELEGENADDTISVFDNPQESFSENVNPFPQVGNEENIRIESSVSVKSSDKMDSSQNTNPFITELKSTEISGVEEDLFPRDVNEVTNPEESHMIPESDKTIVIPEIAFSDAMRTQNEDELLKNDQEDIDIPLNIAEDSRVPLNPEDFHVDFGATSDKTENEEIPKDENTPIELIINNENSPFYNVGFDTIDDTPIVEETYDEYAPVEPIVNSESSDTVADVDSILHSEGNIKTSIQETELEKSDDSNLFGPEESVTNPSNPLETENFDTNSEDPEIMQFQEQELLQTTPDALSSNQDTIDNSYPFEDLRNGETPSQNNLESLSEPNEENNSEALKEETKSLAEMLAEQTNLETNVEAIMSDRDTSITSPPITNAEEGAIVDAPMKESESSPTSTGESFEPQVNVATQEEDENLVDIAQLESVTESILEETDSWSESSTEIGVESLLEDSTRAAVESANVF